MALHFVYLIKKNAIIFKSMSPWTFWNPWHFVGSGGMPLLVSLRSTSPANVSILPLLGLGGSLEEAHQLLLRQGFESTRQGREDKGQYVLEGRQYLDKQAFPVFCCPSPIMWKDLVFWFVSVKKNSEAGYQFIMNWHKRPYTLGTPARVNSMSSRKTWFSL